ncbi:hypothetical protein Tco_0093817 [Tanacetum coccineum]
MSNSDESGVTYTERTPYVGGRLQPQPVSRLVPSPEEPEQAPPSPYYVPGPELLIDEIFNPEADPEEDDDEDPEEDPVDYPANGGDDGDDEDEPSEEDEDDDVDIEADEDEEEEHPAPANSVVVALPATDQTPSAEETEFEMISCGHTTSHSTAYRVTARISIPAPVPTPVIWFEARVLPGSSRYIYSTIITASPWSSPLPQIPLPPLPPLPSPSLPLSPPSPEAVSTSHSLPLPSPFILSLTRLDAPSSGIPQPLPISVPTSSPPLLLPSASRREDRPEVTLPPRKRLGIALGPRYEVGESSSAAAARPAGGLRADYGFVATMDREIRRDPEREVGYRITDFGGMRQLRPWHGWHQLSTALSLGRIDSILRLGLVDTDEIYTEAWRRSMDASDLTRGEVMSLHTTVLGQMSEIRELYAADRRRPAMQSLQGQVTTLQDRSTRTTGEGPHTGNIKGPAGGPAQPELPEEAGSSS